MKQVDAMLTICLFGKKMQIPIRDADNIIQIDF